MKQLYLILSILFFAMCAFSNDWTDYQKLKEKITKAENSLDLVSVSKYTDDILIIIDKLKRPDLKVWRLNNLAYVKIKLFKKETNYDKILDILKVAKESKEKKLLMAEFKQNIIKNIHLLKSAKDDLLLAEELDKNINAKYLDKERTEKIKNNIKFIESVMNYIEN